MLKFEIRFRVPLLIAAALSIAVTVRGNDDKARISFNNEIRPILSDRCFVCHGPDAGSRTKSGLRLDARESVIAPLPEGGYAIVPGKPAQSELVRRIFSKDPAVQMPPADSGLQLTHTERETLKQWIAEGAEYESHWAFMPPVRPELPTVSRPEWIKNAIDAFVLARLEKKRLAPSEEAGRRTLLRRVSFNLTGLPPTREEVQSFLNDRSPGAYENAVDRLLASPRFGERLAVPWLDSARYADTSGYQYDLPRTIWRWRDWVIDAFNHNLPYDQFAVWQIAGDLLPDATLEQKLATGFNRNAPHTIEGGVIEEEYLHEYASDRLKTTGFVFMGLTLDCAKCHDHKYDPVSMKDYYSMYAFFNNVDEKGRGANEPVPLMDAPTREQSRQLEALQIRERELQEKWDAVSAKADAETDDWSDGLQQEIESAWTILTPAVFTSVHGAELQLLEDQSILAGGNNPTNDIYNVEAHTEEVNLTAIRLEILPHESLPHTGPGRNSNANLVMSEFVVEAVSRINPEKREVIKFTRVEADHTQQTHGPFKPEFLVDGDRKSSWASDTHTGRYEPRTLVFVAEKPFGFPGGTELNIQLVHESKHGHHNTGRFRLSLSQRKGEALPVAPLNLHKALLADERSEAEVKLLRESWLAVSWPESGEVSAELKRVRAERETLEKAIPTTLVMKDRAEPRQTHLLIRGTYDQKGDTVEPGTPDWLSPFPEGAPRNRLGFAQWLTADENPLFARVAVNRFWQMIFGNGLVMTAEDFGSQGTPPSHPELLDWLAVEFRESGWDTKHLIRLMVTSATYQQASYATPELRDLDPTNRLLARGPRLRLTAEMVRDQALAHSGLLVEKIGGPSVYPYQPPGLWKDLTIRPNFMMIYKAGSGDDLYRRSLYTFWKRASPPPGLQTFDAPDREFCVIKRSPTNTPLQALVMLNDPTYVEASRFLAERMLKEVDGDFDDRLAFAFEVVTARTPDRRERQVFHTVFEAEREHYQADTARARELLAIGEAPKDESLDLANHAAYTIIASMIFNLDEAVTLD